MQCYTASELMSLRLDALLTAEQERQLAEHLDSCQACQQEWETMLEAMALFEDPEWLSPPPDTTQRVMARIHKRSAWITVLRTLALVMLGSAVLLAIGFVPVVAVLGVAANSPGVFTTLLSAIVRVLGLLGTVLGALATLTQAMFAGNGAIVLAGGALICVILMIQWTRVVSRPRRLVAK